MWTGMYESSPSCVVSVERSTCLSGHEGFFLSFFLSFLAFMGMERTPHSINTERRDRYEKNRENIINHTT